MRRDLLVTALIFAIVGFIAGTLFTGAVGDAAPARPVAPPPRPTEQPASGGGLPEGHPPMELAARWQELRVRAESNPGDVGPAVELANFLYDQGAWDQAALWFEKALAIEPGDTDLRTVYAIALYKMNRVDDAVREYEAVLAVEPDKPQALFGLAHAKVEKLNDRAGAAQILERLRRVHPGHESIVLLESLLDATKAAE